LQTGPGFRAIQLPYPSTNSVSCATTSAPASGAWPCRFQRTQARLTCAFCGVIRNRSRVLDVVGKSWTGPAVLVAAFGQAQLARVGRSIPGLVSPAKDCRSFCIRYFQEGRPLAVYQEAIEGLLGGFPDFRTVFALCWPQAEQEALVHYAGPWITGESGRF
jgi:hypothetical protein